MDDPRTTIARVAQEEGINPAYALAVADRESSFNPNAHASKTIYGLFQMKAGERAKYGAGDSADPETQTRAFAAYTRDLQGEMAGQLGRAPTDQETYLGHFWGGPRASRTINGSQAGLSPQDMFTQQELAANPELAKGTNAGALATNIMGDISRRQAKFAGGDDVQQATGPDFTQHGVQEPAAAPTGNAGAAPASTSPGSEVDLASLDYQMGLNGPAATGTPPPPAQQQQPASSAPQEQPQQQQQDDPMLAQPPRFPWLQPVRLPSGKQAKPSTQTTVAGALPLNPNPTDFTQFGVPQAPDPTQQQS